MLFACVLVGKIIGLVLLDILLLIGFSVFADRMEKRLLPNGGHLLAMRAYDLVDFTILLPNRLDDTVAFIITLLATPFVATFGLFEIALRLAWKRVHTTATPSAPA